MASYNFLPQIQNTSQSQTTAPSWQPQVGALTNAFSGATDAYNNQLRTGPYSGDYYAAPNDVQYGAYNQAANFASNNGGVGQNQINTGQGLLNNFGTATNAANGLYNFGATDQTQNNINTANQYANNPYIDQAVNAATYGANRNAAENDVPNLYRAAASSGNLNSNRAALAQGVIGRGLAENAQNIGANMRYNMFNQGLNTALNQNTQRMGALSNAGNMSSNLGATGSGMMSQGVNDQTNISNLYSTAGEGLNALQQNIINNKLAKYQGNINNPWDAVQKYYGIVGNNNWGSTTNSNSSSMGFSPVANQHSTPGALSYLGAGLGVLGGAAGLATGGGSTLGGAALTNLFPRFFKG